MTLEEHIEATLRRVLDEKLRPLEDAVRHIREPEDVLSVEDAAALLGWQPRTVRIKAKAGTIPAFKPPGSREWRFRRAALVAWQTAAAVDTEAESSKIVASLRGRR